MTNEEIDIRLKNISDLIPSWADKRQKEGKPQLETELELLNMACTPVYAMLGEIAKRLPESGMLTKREQIAAMALNEVIGRIELPMPGSNLELRAGHAAKISVQFADALLEELEKT